MNHDSLVRPSCLIFVCIFPLAACRARSLPTIPMSVHSSSSSSSVHSQTVIEYEKERIMLKGPNGQTIAINAEIADDDRKRRMGLMFRKRLDDGEGMLFSFEYSQMLNFWMKNTLIPLDIIFFDHGGRFVSAAAMTPCDAGPCRVYQSAQPAQWALELPAGFTAKTGAGAGWSLAFGGE